MMRIGIFAKTFPGTDPATVLGASAAAGYAGVAYNMACSGLAAMPDEIGTGTTDAIVAAARSTGLEIMSLSATFNMAHPDPEVRATGLGRLDVLAGVAKSIGTNLLTLCTGTRDPDDQWRHHPENRTPEAWRDMIETFEQAVAIAERHNVFLGVEPELANVIDSAAAARRLIRDMGSERIRIVLDPANLFEIADDRERQRLIEEAVDRLCDRIVMAHAKDRHANGSFATAGAGVIDFSHFFGRLASSGFDGPVVTHSLAAGEARGVAEFLKCQLHSLSA